MNEIVQLKSNDTTTCVYSLPKPRNRIFPPRNSLITTKVNTVLNFN